MNLASLLDLPAMIAPDSVVVVDTTGGGPARRITYEDLRARVAGTVGLLRHLGVGPGDRVALFATNSAAAVEVIMATAAAGGVVVPMNFRAGREEAAHLLTDSGASVLFTESRYRPLLQEAGASIDAVVYLDEDHEQRRDATEPDFDVADVDDDDLAVLLYTSGTTSLPKGVKLNHGALTGYVMGANDAADGSDNGTMLLAAPLYHVAGLTSLLNAVYSGRVTVLMSQFDPERWLELVPAHGVTHAFLVPTMLARLLDCPGFAQADLSGLRGLTYGAAPMPPAVIRRAIEAFPDTVEFSGAYGQTETTSTVAVLGPEDHKLDDETKLTRLRSVGRVLDDVEVRVVGPGGEVLGPGATGEVQLRTYRTMDGYWGAEEKTRVTIDDEGWVHTGDLGHLDEDNYLFLTGRAGDMIIRGGENVAPEEVEAVLYDHPDVIEAAVVGLADETWGERVVAAVVLRPGASVDDVAAHARAHLAPFKRPEVIHVLDELPRTSTGKLLRRNLVPALQEAGI